MARAAVIGGTGPTGRIVVQLLRDRGSAVTVCHSGAHELDRMEGVTHVHGDVRDPAFLSELASQHFDVVFCMYGSLKRQAAAFAGRCRNLVAVTGIPVYRGAMAPPWAPGVPLPIPEDAPRLDDDGTWYRGRIMRGEDQVLALHDKGAFCATIFRYPAVYGPHVHNPSEWYVVRRILDGRTRIVLPDNGLAFFHRGYVRNLAFAIVSSLDHEAAAGEIFNIGDERTLNARQLVTVILRHMHATAEMVSLPYELSPHSWPAAERASLIVDLSKARRLLDYHDVVSAEDALRDTVDWLMKHRPVPGGPEETAIGGPPIDYVPERLFNVPMFDYATEDKFIDRYIRLAEEFHQGLPAPVAQPVPVGFKQESELYFEQ